MYVVALLGWSPGFVVNRLVEVLLHGFSLADAFRVASQLAEGSQVTIPFSSLQGADEFARQARALGVRLELRLPTSAAELRATSLLVSVSRRSCPPVPSPPR